MHGILILCVAVPRCAALVSAQPFWLSRPLCRSEPELKQAAAFMLPPRRVEETHLDSNGRSTSGRCLPYAVLLECQRLGDLAADVPSEGDLAAIHALRDSVVDFAVQNQDLDWNSDGCETLGHVIAAVAQNRGWAIPGLPRSATVAIWAARTRASPREGCDAAFLFCSAARYGLRINVLYQRPNRSMARAQFAVPKGAGPQLLSPTRTIHVGYVDNGDQTNHYVSLPPLLPMP